MDKQLEEKLSLSAKSVWRIYSFIQIAVLTVIYSLLLYILNDSFVPLYMKFVVGLVLVVYFIVIILIVPNVRWNILSYEVRDHEIEIQTGLFVVKRTIIPIIRVQHVDVMQGPLIKKKNLANIDITTAATTHTIPLLHSKDADELRLKISELARMAKEDV
jgi:uncharacterized protein